MALNSCGALNKAKGFSAYFKSNKDGIVTAKNGEHLLAKGWAQDAKTGAISKEKGVMAKAARHPYLTTASIVGGGVGGAMAYGYMNGGGGMPIAIPGSTPNGDSFSSSA